VFPGLSISKILLLTRTDRRTAGHGYIASACLPDQEYIYCKEVSLAGVNLSPDRVTLKKIS